MDPNFYIFLTTSNREWDELFIRKLEGKIVALEIAK